MKEKWLHLINTARCYKYEVENREQAELQIERSVINHPEREATEKSGKYV